jgi:hypothetical protein
VAEFEPEQIWLYGSHAWAHRQTTATLIFWSWFRTARKRQSVAHKGPIVVYAGCACPKTSWSQLAKNCRVLRDDQTHLRT